MRRRSVLAPILAATVVVVSAGCTPTSRWVSPNSGAGGPSATPTARPSAGAAAWKPCPEVAAGILRQQSPPPNLAFECASVPVPQDWAAKDSGKTFDIALLRVHATNQGNRIGSLLVDPGGPGGSGVDLAVYLSQQLPTDVLRRFDVVGFDPRGVGRSNAVKCFSDADLDAFFGGDPDPVGDADFDAVAKVQANMAKSCGDKYGDSLRLFSTEQTARDMDVLRQAVGDPKLTYLGFSYGTLLGGVYAELFPDHIRAMVLDGAVDPTQNSIDAGATQVKGFEHAFDNFSAWCKANASKCPIAPDARAAVVSAMQSAHQSPVRGVGGSRTATPGWIMTAVTSALYSQETWPILAAAIDDLRQNSAAKLFALADAYAERDPTGHYSNLFDAFLTISCTDDPTTLSRAKVRELQGTWRQQFPLFGPSAATQSLVCSQWPGKRDPYPTGKAGGAPPIVVVGTTGDPATPYEQTAKLADMLGVGVVLTWQGEGHTAYPQTRCINDAVNKYLIDLTPPAKGTTCPAR